MHTVTKFDDHFLYSDAMWNGQWSLIKDGWVLGNATTLEEEEESGRSLNMLQDDIMDMITGL